MSKLEIRNLEVSYGVTRAVKGISLTVGEGEIVALIGANGAGKTSTLSAIMRMAPWTGGDILYDGQSLRSLDTAGVLQRGIAISLEGRRVFPSLSVRENLIAGAYTRKSRAEVAETLEAILNRFPILRERASQMAGTLSGGEQQMLAIGRALMARPRVLLLDEPCLGLAPKIRSVIADMIREVRNEGISILIAEQNAKWSLDLADRAVVLELGEMVVEGRTAELRQNEHLQQAYLGR